MELLVTGKNLDVTPRDRDYIEKKLATLQRHFKSLPILVLQIVLAEEKTKAVEKRFIVEFTANVRDTLLRAEERGPDLHVAIDRAAEVMDRQIERFHGRRQAKRHSAPTGATAAPELVEPGPSDGEELPSRVVKVKRHILKPMSVDEAVDQMELLGHDFFVFLNCDTDELNVVYRRRAGDYGIIESQAA